MTRNEILEKAGEFYRPETITEREIAFARHMMKAQREELAKKIEAMPFGDTGASFAAWIREQA